MACGAQSHAARCCGREVAVVGDMWWACGGQEGCEGGGSGGGAKGREEGMQGRVEDKGVVPLNVCAVPRGSVRSG